MEIYALGNQYCFFKLLYLFGNIISDNFDKDCSNAGRKWKLIVSQNKPNSIPNRTPFGEVICGQSSLCF